MDKNGGDHDQEKSPQGSGVPSRLYLGSAGQAENEHEQKPVRGFRVVFDDKIKPYLELFVGIAAIAGLILVYQQLEAMKETNRMTQESNASSDRTTERTLKIMEESNRLTRKALEETKKQAEASRAQSAADAQTNLELARRSFESNLVASKTSQRAKLVVESSELTLDKSGQPTGGHFTIRNAGQLPATDVRWQVCLAGGRLGGGSVELKAMMPVIPRWWLNQQRDTIGPGAMRVLPLSPRYYNLFCPKVPQDGLMSFLVARIQYLDGFNQERYVDACTFWTSEEITKPEPATVQQCVGFTGDGPIEELLPKAKKR